MYKIRHIQEKLALMAKHFKVVLITGARQVGKTTLLKNTFPTAKIITFDPQEDVHNARSEPHLFFKSFPQPLILDEIQYAPELLPLLKRIVDENDAPGQYFMTGSHNLSLLSQTAESMAGRVGILDLAPMTTYEQTDAVTFNKEHEQDPQLWLEYYLKNPPLLLEHFAGVTEQSLIHALWRGGMPQTLTLPQSLLFDFFSSYTKTYIERDIRVMLDLTNLIKFRQFIQITAALTGQEINNTELGREIDINRKTARTWLDLMFQTYLWHELAPYTTKNNIKRLVSKKHKGYFGDTGLACHLVNISDPTQILTYRERGALFETLVINTIRTLLSAMPYRAGMFYWRTLNNAEVDLLLEINGAIYPIEIKMKGSLSGHDGSGLRAFRATHQNDTHIKTGLIIYAGTECRWFDNNTIALPWNALMKKR